MNRATPILTSLLVLAAAASASAGARYEYVIGPRDLLSVTVFSNAAAGQGAGRALEGAAVHDVRVSDAGEVSFPIVGKVPAANRTPQRFEAELLEAHRRFYKEPQVSVIVKEYRAHVVYVLGQVPRNGPIYLTHSATSLEEVISEAGGFLTPQSVLTEGADARNVIVTRGDTRRVVNMHALLTNLSKVESFFVQAGDQVYVPKPLKRFQVLGGANRAGEFELTEGMTLLRALSLAGSFNDKARRERVMILRLKPDGTREALNIDCRRVTSAHDPDPLLKPSDVVFVPEW